MHERDSQPNLQQQLKTPLLVIGGFVALLWLIEIVDQLIFGGRLDSFGVHPRTLSGLWGILWAPLLHSGFRHLLANTGPLLILGSIVMLSRRLRDFFLISFVVVFVGGLAPGSSSIARRFILEPAASSLATLASCCFLPTLNEAAEPLPLRLLCFCSTAGLFGVCCRKGVASPGRHIFLGFWVGDWLLTYSASA